MRTPGKIIPERPGAWVLSAFVTRRVRGVREASAVSQRRSIMRASTILSSSGKFSSR